MSSTKPSDLSVKNTKKEMLEADYQMNLLKKQFDGEKNVSSIQIQSLEKMVKEQNEQIAKLSKLQEATYQKVQDVAVKAIEGASKVGSFSGLQHIISEQKKSAAD